MRKRYISEKYVGNTTLKQRWVNSTLTLPTVWTRVTTPLEKKMKGERKRNNSILLQPENLPQKVNE